jgi:transglutaminase-like putative cysteine protease
MISLQTETQDLTAYLTASEIVDFENPAIRKIATELAHSAPSQLEQATRIYEFVRDQVSHSFDIQGKVVTCNASEVLHHREGICFAKSHLLTAMLRCIGIPSGFCY